MPGFPLPAGQRIDAKPTRAAGAISGLPLPPGPLIGFGVAILAVILISFFSYRAQEVRARTAELVSHTIEVREQLQSLVSILKDAETGQRGFLLTSSENYLLPYTNAKAALPGQLKRLRSLISDNPEQVQRLDSAALMAQDKMDELAESIELQRTLGAEAALAVVRTNRGKMAMDRLRAITDEMELHERNLLVNRQEEWRDAVVLASMVTWIGSGVLLVLIVAAAVMT